MSSFPSLEPDSSPATMDTLLSRLGSPGRHQAVLVLLLATNLLPVMFQEVAVPLAASPVDHHCKVPGPPDTEPLFLPPGQQCQVWRNPSNHSHGMVPCNRGHQFLHPSPDQASIVAEWSLVCERAHLLPVLSLAYLTGLLVGGLTLGWVADSLGRRPVMLACLYSQCLLAIATHWVTRIEVFLAIRAAQGLLVTGLQVTTYTLVLELVSPGWRPVATSALQLVWSGGILLVAVVAKYVLHWRYTQLALHVPTLATLLYIWVVPESTRWLVCRGRVQKAEVILTSIISYNSLKLDPGSLRLEMEAVSRDLVARQDARRPPSLTSLLRARPLRLQVLVLVVAWLASSLAFAGLQPEPARLLTGDRFLDLALQGGLAIATALLTGLLAAGFGRRWPLCLLLSLLGLSCLSLTSVGLTHHPVPTTLPTGLNIIGRCFAFATICLLFLYSSELAPTSLRARSLASCCSVAAAGSLIAPFLSKIAPHLPVAPLVVQGLLALLAAILVPALPDTGDRPMPDTVEEAEMMAAPKKKPLNASSDSLDVGYGKCPEFVLVDGLIVSKECPSSSWEGSSDSGRGATEYSVTESGEDSTSHGGTISTLRSSGRTQLLGWGENPSLLSQFKPPELPQFKSMETSSVQGSKMMSSLEASSLSDSWRQTKAEGRGEDRLLPLFSLSNGSKFGSNGSTSSRTNLVSQHPSLDSSVVSAEHSILFANGETAGNNNNNINSSKDGVIKEILRRKLLALDSDETRL